MKVTVLKRFRDVNNLKKVYAKGAVFEGTKERVSELQNKTYLGETIEEKKNTKPPEESK